MTEIPHFTLPLQFAGPGLVVTEQDTADDILSCALAIVLCPLGFRAELPEFGVADSTFSEGMAHSEPYAEALAEWEPRVDATVTARLDTLDALITNVRVRLGVPSGD
jgi:phage baseplate assembly protein W